MSTARNDYFLRDVIFNAPDVTCTLLTFRYSFSVDKRKEAVLHRRNLVKDQAAVRRNALIASRNYQAFRADVDDLKTWLTDKLKTASDESYRDLTNIERKLQKHEAFECELRANEGQLRNINKVN